MKILVLLVVMFSAFLNGCKDERRRVEVFSVANGNGVDAQVFRTESGATVSDQYEVWLSDSKGATTKKKVLLADKAASLQLKWASTDKLTICYEKAQVHEFSNYMVSLKSDGSVLHDIQVDIFRDPDRCRSSPPVAK